VHPTTEWLPTTNRSVRAITQLGTALRTTNDRRIVSDAADPSAAEKQRRTVPIKHAVLGFDSWLIAGRAGRKTELTAWRLQDRAHNRILRGHSHGSVRRLASSRTSGRPGPDFDYQPGAVARGFRAHLVLGLISLTGCGRRLKPITGHSPIPIGPSQRSVVVRVLHP
jgi:hypothetical protein